MDPISLLICMNSIQLISLLSQSICNRNDNIRRQREHQIINAKLQNLQNEIKLLNKK